MKLSARNTFQKGFTLIELLVVIGILGILAAALVATIDPFEQLKKGTDAKTKNMAVEFQTSLIRYYTTHTSFPWNDADSIEADTNPNCTSLGGAPIDGLALNDSNLKDCIEGTAYSLIYDGELKSAFTINDNDLSKVYLTWNPVDKTNPIICFSPTAKAGKGHPETIYTAADGETVTPADTCPDPGADDNVCFWCTR